MQKKIQSIVLLGIMLSLLVPVCSVMAEKKTKATGKDAALLLANTDDDILNDAEGKANVVNPEGNWELIINATMSGLGPHQPNYASAYNVHISLDGDVDYVIDEYFAFTPNQNGQASWQYRVPAGTFAADTYTCTMQVSNFIFVDGSSSPPTVILESVDDFFVEISAE